jgi:membrane protease subunit HflK
MLDLLIILIIAGFFFYKNFKQLGGKNKNPWNNINENQEKGPLNDAKKVFDNIFNSLFKNNNKNIYNQSSSSNQNGNLQDSFVNKININKFIFIFLFLSICIWSISGFYIVQPDEEGVETFLGRYSKTTSPGLHFRIPYPVTKVYKIKVTRINTEEIGYRSSSSISNDDPLVLIESTMVTKDENIIDVNFDVQWRIQDAAKFVFNIKAIDISSTIRFASESIMRDLIGINNMSFALGEGRAILAEQARVALQKILDEYQVGISILSIPIKKIDPPKEVISSFRDVQSARSDKEREINMALAYKNDILPRARGEAAKIVNESEAYYYTIVNKANGEVAKMNSLYPYYRQNKELVKTKLYTDLMSDVFYNINKIIIPGNLDSKNINSGQNNQVNFLNMSEIFKNMNDKKN